MLAAERSGSSGSRSAWRPPSTFETSTRAVGADKAVASFGDQDAAFAPHDAAALLDGEFDDASVELIAFGPAAGSGGGFDCVQRYQLAFGLGDDFVFDDQDVAVAEFLFVVF